MFRSLALFCFAAVLAFSPVFAQGKSQDTPKSDKIKPTPEILSLFDESLQSLLQSEPKNRAGGLFRLLGFCICFDDPAPAKKIIETLLTLAPAIESEELRNQLYEGVASALCDLEEYTKAVEILNRIVKPADRYECQQNIAVKIIVTHENDKTLKPFDATELVRQAIAGAVEAKNLTSEALSRIFLGRELARQDKKTEAIAAFAEATRTVKKIEDAGEQGQIMPLVLQSQAKYGLLADALATLQTITDPDSKQIAAYALIQALVQNKNHDDAEKLLKTLPADSSRDSALHYVVIGREKTITDEKIGELAALASAEHRETFLQGVVVLLRSENRDDTANQVAKRFKKPSEAKTALFLGKLRFLLDKKQFVDAIQLINESEENADSRLGYKRSVLAKQYAETSEDAVAQKFLETYSKEEMLFVTELKEDAKKAVEIPDPDMRLDTLLEILHEQTQCMDIAGKKQTLKFIAEQLDKETEPVRIIEYRLLFAQLQITLREKNGAKENLGKLTKTLSDVKDLKVLKDLVQEQPMIEEGIIKLQVPVDESAIKNQLFGIYLMTASLSADADAPVESKSAFEKAKEFAKAEPDAVQKAEKLFILAQFLAEQLSEP
jgi:tetratricopeptide (TPR) repeat protein